MSISHVMADGIATHRALKLMGRVGHHMMVVAIAAQAKMRSAVFTTPPRPQCFSVRGQGGRRVLTLS
jgi:hypothetical protein